MALRPPKPSPTIPLRHCGRQLCGARPRARGRDGDLKPLPTPCPTHFCGCEGFGGCLPWTPLYSSACTVLSKAFIKGSHALCWTLQEQQRDGELLKAWGFHDERSPMQDPESTNSNLTPGILCQKGRRVEGQPWSSGQVLKDGKCLWL